MPGGHHHGGHRGGHGGFRGGVSFSGPWWGYYDDPTVIVVDPYDTLETGELGAPPARRPRLLPRHFNETEREARARAELDPATRDRITWAHEHLSTSTGIHPARARRGALRALSGPTLAAHVRRAGLTLGEAEAAGIGK